MGFYIPDAPPAT